MNSKILLSKEVAPGEYQHLFDFVMKDLKLFKRKMLIYWKHHTTNESQEFEQKYYEREYQEQLIELFNNDDFEGMMDLPLGEEGRCATQLSMRYVNSGKLVGLQIMESRPHEDGRSVGLTPAKVFLDEEGEKLIGIVNKLKGIKHPS